MTTAQLKQCFEWWIAGELLKEHCNIGGQIEWIKCWDFPAHEIREQSFIHFKQDWPQKEEPPSIPFDVEYQFAATRYSIRALEDKVDHQTTFLRNEVHELICKTRKLEEIAVLQKDRIDMLSKGLSNLKNAFNNLC